MVLMVLTDKGDFILDIKRGAVPLWRWTGYIFFKAGGHERKICGVIGVLADPAYTVYR